MKSKNLNKVKELFLSQITTQFSDSTPFHHSAQTTLHVFSPSPCKIQGRFIIELEQRYIFFLPPSATGLSPGYKPLGLFTQRLMLSLAA